VNVACRLFGIGQSTYYYQSKRQGEDEMIKEMLQQLASDHPRWGFDKMRYYLKGQGAPWNHKRLYRIYCALGLNLKKKLKKRLPKRIRETLIQPLYANECWSMDFMSDSLNFKEKFRTFNVMDDYNREAILIKASYSLPSETIIKMLDEVAKDRRSYPKKLRCDNGPEFTSRAFMEWAKRHEIRINYIEPGKPAQNGLIERFNRTYREEVLDAYLFNNLREVKNTTEGWIKKYNEERPHQSLGNVSPMQFAMARTQLMLNTEAA